MIKFFRKIRYDLMEKNKTGKYLKYAIGEIILVVIGILIALQINNANEQRKARIQEITILENLKEDITLDTLDINFNLNYHNSFKEAEIALLQFLQSDQIRPLDSIDYGNALGVPLIAALHKSTFINLQNNDIGILTNNTLEKDISRFYDFFNAALAMIENDYPSLQTYSGKKPFFQKYFKLTQNNKTIINEGSNNEDYFNPDFVKLDMQLNDIEGAKNDEAFKIELNESIFFREIKIGFYNDMLIRIRELNEAIELELKSLIR